MKHRTTVPPWELRHHQNQRLASEQTSQRQLEADLSVHIFSVSAALVGVCLTVIGLIRVSISTSKVDTLADDFLAADAMLFLISCLLSYWAMRTRSFYRMHQVERVADTVFLVGLSLMVLICGVVAYALW